MFAFYALATLVVLLGTVINLPGSLHLNPILLHFYEPHKVLFLTMVFLTLGALARVIVFHKQILWREALPLGLLALIGGFIGGYFVGMIPQKIIVILFFISGFIYLAKVVFKKEKKEVSKHGVIIAGTITAFLQAFGISAGAIRQGFLASRGYDLPTIHGTAGVAFIIGSFATITARMMHESFDLKDVVPLLLFFPFMLLTVYIGKRIIYKIPKKIQEAIIIYSLILSLALAIPYLFK